MGNLNNIGPCQSTDPCAGQPQGEYLNAGANNFNQVGGYCYDAAGNLQHMGACGPIDYVWNGDSMLASRANTNYAYDGDLNRVAKTGRTYWRGNGEVLAEYDQNGALESQYIYFGGRRVARKDADGSVHYYFSDHLGSASLVTNAQGGAPEDDSDYYPYGGELQMPNSIPVLSSSFESGSTVGWVTGYWGANSSVTTTQAHSGTYSLAQTGATTGGSYQDVSGLVPGSSYQVSVWVRADAGTTAQMFLWLHDTNGTNAENTAAMTPGQNWQQVTLTYVADSTGKLRIHLHYIAGAGTIYYDDVQVLAPAGNNLNHYTFTGKERDDETGNDYFGARYYNSSMGRMTSPDPGNIGVKPENPQSWNLYSYSLNNPLSFTDPTGLYVCEDSTKCDSKNDQAFAKSLADAQTAANKLTGDDKAAAQRAIDAYGAQGVDNGVNVRFDSNVTGGVTEVSGVANGDKSADNPTGQNINVTFNPNAVGGDFSGGLVGHEGSTWRMLLHGSPPGLPRA